MNLSKETLIIPTSRIPIFSYTLIPGRASRIWVDMITLDDISRGCELIVHLSKSGLDYSFVTEIGNELDFEIEVINTTGNKISVYLTNKHITDITSYSRILYDESEKIYGYI